MNRLRMLSVTLWILTALVLSTPASARPPGQTGAAQGDKVMREFRGVKLGMKIDAVHTALGKPETAGENQEEYKISGDDSVTVYYENGVVKTIRLYLTNPKNVPAWTEVVGDTEVKQLESGMKNARRVMSEEKFWVSMSQNKDGTVTTITIQSTAPPPQTN